MAFVERRIGDGSILRLLQKWIHVGVIENGRLLVTETGTGQGQVISPLLANIYLHYVLDEWFEHEVKPRLRRRPPEIRYADDFILCFQYREDAERVGGAYQAIREVRVDASPREDAAAGVRPLGTPERTRRAEAGDLRLSRLHARLCAQPTGAVCHSRPDHPQTSSAQCEGGGAVVPAASAQTRSRTRPRRSMPNSGAITGTIRATDELPVFTAVLSVGPSALAQVAHSANAWEAAALARFRAAAGTPSVVSPAYLSRLGRGGEPWMRNQVRQSRTLGSVRGGDGAAMETLTGHAAGNGGYSQGKPTAATGPLLLGNVQDLHPRPARSPSKRATSTRRAMPPTPGVQPWRPATRRRNASP